MRSKSTRAICVVLSVLFLLVLTGCVNFEYHLTINRDGSAEVEYTYQISSSLLALSSVSDPITGYESTAKEAGYTVSDASTSDMKGYKAAKHFSSVQEINLGNISGLPNSVSKDALGFTVKKGLFSDTYLLDSHLDLSSLKQTGENADLINSMLSQVKLKIVVSLPAKASSSNAATKTVDGKTLGWNLSAGEDNQLQLSVSVPNQKNILIVCCVFAGLLLIAIGLLCFFHFKRKKAAAILAAAKTAAEISEQENQAEPVLDDPADDESAADESVGETPASDVENDTQTPSDNAYQSTGPDMSHVSGPNLHHPVPPVSLLAIFTNE